MANLFDTFGFPGSKFVGHSCTRLREQLPVRSPFALPRLLIPRRECAIPEPGMYKR